jgi:hypothetical protein
MRPFVSARVEGGGHNPCSSRWSLGANVLGANPSTAVYKAFCGFVREMRSTWVFYCLLLTPLHDHVPVPFAHPHPLTLIMHSSLPSVSPITCQTHLQTLTKNPLRTPCPRHAKMQKYKICMYCTYCLIVCTVPPVTLIQCMSQAATAATAATAAPRACDRKGSNAFVLSDLF